MRPLLWCFNFAGDNKTYLGLHIKYPILLPDSSRQNSMEVPNIKFQWNPPSGGPRWYMPTNELAWER